MAGTCKWTGGYDPCLRTPRSGFLWQATYLSSAQETVADHASAKDRPADLIGRVVFVSADDTQMTLRLPPKKEDLLPTASVRIGERTVIEYGRIAKNLQKPCAGLMAAVWLEKGSKDLAVKVRFGGPVKRPLAADALFELPKEIELTSRQRAQVETLMERLAPLHEELIQRKNAVLTAKQKAAQAVAEKAVQETGLTDEAQIQAAVQAAADITPRQKERLEAITRREENLRRYFLERLSAILTDQQKQKLQHLAGYQKPRQN